MVWKTVRSSWKPSDRLPSTRRSRLILASARTRAWRVGLISDSFVVFEQREDVVPAQPLAPAEEGQLHHEAQSHHHAPGVLYHPRRRRRRAAGGQQVVHDQHAVALAHRVLVPVSYTHLTLPTKRI